MSILFINASPNKNGNTAKLAKELLTGKEYTTLNLIDYKIYSHGQEYPDDQFNEVIDEIRKADTVIMGSPMYWHNICGLMRNFLDRCYGLNRRNGSLKHVSLPCPDLPACMGLLIRAW
ncbi:flavodoxin family protein [Gemella sanguinis]|uniref:flavodoxin family protein n=1 Tax=Gemella sanguinis TaxID=84135 RepID=UPI0028E963A2|nr:flavodoxin family protein [Gemella sanguinis]